MVSMEKWYNFETSSVSLAERLSAFLKRCGIYYERSGAYSYYHFEIVADDKEVNAINSFLDENTMAEG